VVAAVSAEVERTGVAPEGLPRLVQRFGTQDLPAPLQPPAPQSDGLEDDLCALFRSLTQRSPRIIWIDDLDLADPGTWSAFALLGRNLVRTGSPLLLVATLRLGSGPLPPALKRILTGESTGIRPRQIGLGPLGRGDVLELIESMYPRDPRSQALAVRLHEEAAGNPLAVVEVIRLLVARGRMGRRVVDGERRWVMALTSDEIRDRVQLPKGIPALLQTRLTAYPGQTRTLLRLIAVWGREIRFKTLLRLASASEEAVLAHLDRLLADGWLAEDWLGGDDRYVLAHPSYRAVLLSELTAADQSRLRGFIDMRLGLKREGG
jgi:predicted ATPase